MEPAGKDYLSSRAGEEGTNREGETGPVIGVSQQHRQSVRKDRSGITVVGGGARAVGRRISGWSRRWAATPLGTAVARNNEQF